MLKNTQKRITEYWLGLKKRKFLVIILLVFAVGFFLRAYKFSDWLHFELDQARDAYLIQEVLEAGPEKLPLLGPRAAGTFLRLGPAFYYIEYIFSALSGNIIVGSALAVVFFSFLSLPASYLFFAKGFTKKTSVVLTTIFSFSLFMVTYSRFAWNPNLLPFFILALLFSLLSAVDSTLEPKKRGWWLVLAGFFLGILSQFHFLALIIVSIVSAVFILLKRPKIKIKYWIMAVVVLLVLYTPFIANEYITKGLNSKQFLSAVTNKSQKSSYSFPEKVIRNATQNADFFWIILTGSQSATFPSVVLGGGGDVQCNWDCRQHLGEGFVAIVFFVLAVGALFLKLYKIPKGAAKDFLLLNAILFLVSFVVFIPLAYNFSSRFFLIVFPVVFVCFGLLFDELSAFLARKKLLPNIIGFALVFCIVFANLFFTFGFFQQLNSAKSAPLALAKDKILKQKTRITLEQQLAIVEYMQEGYQKEGLPVIFNGQSEFHRSLAFIFDQRGVPRNGINRKKICRKANYYLINRSQSDLGKLDKYFQQFDVAEQKDFGTLVVYKLRPKDGVITCEEFAEKNFVHGNNENEKGIAKRYSWQDVFDHFGE